MNGIYRYLQEGKDKQFLLAKIADLTGEGKKKAPALRTVNENKHQIEVSNIIFLTLVMLNKLRYHA